jgi:hypothetical protein
MREIQGGLIFSPVAHFDSRNYGYKTDLLELLV